LTLQKYPTKRKYDVKDTHLGEKTASSNPGLREFKLLAPEFYI